MMPPNAVARDPAAAKARTSTFRPGASSDRGMAPREGFEPPTLCLAALSGSNSNKRAEFWPRWSGHQSSFPDESVELRFEVAPGLVQLAGGITGLEASQAGAEEGGVEPRAEEDETAAERGEPVAIAAGQSF